MALGCARRRRTTAPSSTPSMGASAAPSERSGERPGTKRITDQARPPPSAPSCTAQSTPARQREDLPTPEEERPVLGLEGGEPPVRVALGDAARPRGELELLERLAQLVAGRVALPR